MNTLTCPRTVALAALPATIVFGAWWLGSDRPVVQPLPGGKFTDMHCHTAGIGSGESGCFTSAALRRSFKFSWYLRAFGTSVAELERGGDHVVIDRISAQVARSNHV